MPIHDWTNVDAGIFYAFHHGWIEELSRALNRGLLPQDYYALPEQLPLLVQMDNPKWDRSRSTAELERRRKYVIAIRRNLEDRLVAQLQVVSPEDKGSGKSLLSLADRVRSLLEMQIHTLIVDLLPPGPLDSNGVHNLIWTAMNRDGFEPPSGKPLTLVSYTSNYETCAYLETISVGDVLPDMPLFLEPERYVAVPLEQTYQAAFAEVPRRWRTVLESPNS